MYVLNSVNMAIKKMFMVFYEMDNQLLIKKGI